VLTAARADDALMGALLGGYAQDGATPLYYASQIGHKKVVKLLLAHADVKINQADEVRGRRVAGKERGQGGQAGVHTMVLRRRPAHFTAVRLMCDTACTCSHMWGWHTDGAGRCAWRWREGTGLQRGRL
jgi:hypothetical protein